MFLLSFCLKILSCSLPTKNPLVLLSLTSRDAGEATGRGWGRWSETTTSSEMTTCKEPHGGHPRRGARRGVNDPPPPHRSSERATTAPGRWPSPRTTTHARVPPHASRLSEDGPHGVPCKSLSPRALWSPTTVSSMSVPYYPKTFSIFSLP